MANKASVPWPEQPCHLVLYHFPWFSKLWPDLPGQPSLPTTDPLHMLFLLCTHFSAFYPPDSQGSCGEHELENLTICHWSPLQSPLGLPIPLSKHMTLSFTADITLRGVLIGHLCLMCLPCLRAPRGLGLNAEHCLGLSGGTNKPQASTCAF